MRRTVAGLFGLVTLIAGLALALPRGTAPDVSTPAPALEAPPGDWACTFSIVAHDPDKKEWGIAVASKYLAVGSAVPWAKAGVGAVATQSFVNVTYGSRGLELLADGKSAED